MNPAIEISLCVLAWLIALNRGRKALLSRSWESDPIAFGVGSASWFFALTMTFLVTPLSNVINSWTYPNFSRLLAYSSVAVTLYLTTSSSLITFPTPKNQRQLKWIKPYLILTLGLLLFSYYFFVSRTAEWLEQPIPGTAAEMIFKLVLFTFATLLCSMIAIACIRYLNQEKVIVTKYRLVTIIFTAIGGGAFFFTKTVLALSYLWHPLGAEWIHTLSKLLMVGTALLWGGSFIHSNMYARVLAFSRGVRYWPIYQDLASLVEKLEKLCPPIGMSIDKPNFWQFVRKSDYFLYRALVHILDGKTMIADFLDDTIPVDKAFAKWDVDGYLEAARLNNVLKTVETTDKYLDLITSYRVASRKLQESTS